MTAKILYTENPAQENLVCMRPVEVSGHIFSDQTGIFPRVSSKGNRSVMVLYDYDINAILTKTIKKHNPNVGESADMADPIPAQPGT